MPKVNINKIKAVFKDIEIESDLERLADELDGLEAAKSFFNTEDGKVFANSIRDKFVRSLNVVLSSKDDELRSSIEKMRACIGIYQIFVDLDEKVEKKRNRIDEIIKETLAT